MLNGESGRMNFFCLQYQPNYT